MNTDDSFDPNAAFAPQPDTLPAAESIAPQPAEWSPRARALLRLAIVAGVLLALYGLSLLSQRISLFDLLSVLGPVLGVAFVMLGGLLAFQSARLLSTSGPTALYRPGDSAQAQRVFGVIWFVGSLILATLTAATGADGLKFFLVVSTSVGLILAGVAAWWLMRWLGMSLEARWSPLQASGAPRVPNVAWSVFFAFVWGICSTVLAIRLELFMLEAALPAIQARLTLSSSSGPASLLRDPAVIVALIGGVAIVAPIIEEVSKAAGLWLLRGSIRAHDNGLLLGLAAGLGFGFIESAGYILGLGGGILVFLLVWLRVATMLMHSLTTGLIGAGYARARLAGDRGAVRSGFLRAIGIHGVWNGGVVLALLLGSEINACVLLAVLGVMIIAAAQMMPRIVKAAIDNSIQDDHARAGVALPANWFPFEDGLWWRLIGGRPQLPPREANSGM